MLLEWLDFQRATLAIKCAGLSADQLARRSAPPSTLSLARVVRHLADMEIIERQVLMDEPVAAHYAVGEANEEPADGMYDFSIYDTDDDALAVWRAACTAMDDALLTFESLDEPVRSPAYGVLTGRSVVLHLLMEYARHNGHADLLRERLDGRTGY